MRYLSLYIYAKLMFYPKKPHVCLTHLTKNDILSKILGEFIHRILVKIITEQGNTF